MRKLLFIALVLTTVIFSSCSKKDDLATDDLTGTTWKSVDDPDAEYVILKFTSKTVVEIWYKDVGVAEIYKEMTGVYSISGNQITINFGEEPFTGGIEGKTMNFSEDGEVMTFTKL